MQILFHGEQSSEEVAESVLSILKLFKDRYGIQHFREMHLDVTLIDNEGEDVELVDANTQEVLGVFDIYKSNEVNEDNMKKKKHLRLVVDNT